jgi:hypothetical protein
MLQQTKSIEPWLKAYLQWWLTKTQSHISRYVCSTSKIDHFLCHAAQGAKRKHNYSWLSEIAWIIYRIIDQSNWNWLFEFRFSLALSILVHAVTACINRTARIRHQLRQTTALSCHRCLINTGVEKMNNI